MNPTTEDIIDAVVLVVSTAQPGAVVASVRNGRSTWARTPGAGQTYWIIGHQETRSPASGVGGSIAGTGKFSRLRTFAVDGWMPWSVDKGTTPLFRDAFDAVQGELILQRTLGICAQITKWPYLAYNRLDYYSSLQQYDQKTLCHHCQLRFQARVWNTKVTG